MRIAFVHPKMNVKGGAENIVVWLSRELGRRGHRVSVFTEAFISALWPDEWVRNLDVRILSKAGGPSFISSNSSFPKPSR